MHISKKWEVSIDFSSKFLINSLASGGPPLEPPTNADFQIFLNYYPNFREKFEKIWQNFG